MLSLALLTVVIISLAFLVISMSKYAAEKVFAVAFVLLLLVGAIPLDRAFVAMLNPGVITLVCLFVIAGSLRITGAMHGLLTQVLSLSPSSQNTNLRLLPLITSMSAFFNNTPIVAAMAPSIVDWCKQVKISPTKILLPLSYAAILGGTCTVIGTSTNLIVYGLLDAQFPKQSFGFFEIGKIGLPISIFGLLYLLLFSNIILPNRKIMSREQNKNNFFSLAGTELASKDRGNKTVYAWLGLLTVIVLAAFSITNIAIAAGLGVLVVLFSGAIKANEAIGSIDFRVIAIILFAFGFGEAIEHSGLAKLISIQIGALKIYGPFIMLVAIYLLTLFLTELVTNNAAAVISFALISSLVTEMNFNIVPFAVAIMIAASTSFITPFGYQTNLMVYSAGNYRVSDYLRLGLPLSISVMIVSLVLIPFYWALAI